MSKNVLILAGSSRKRGNSDILCDAFKQGAKALILCNPSNPCGKVFTKDELEIIAFLAKKYDAYVITDEVYEHIIYSHENTQGSCLVFSCEYIMCS